MKDFTIVRKGFDTTEVDTYIVDLEAEIAKRDKKLEEYRSKEDAINRAVVDAQLIADAIVAKARAEASNLKHEASVELEALRQQALTLRTNLVEFQESYNRILRRYLFSSHCTDMNQLFTRLETLLHNVDTDPDSLGPLPQVYDHPMEETVTPAVTGPSFTTDYADPIRTLDELSFTPVKGE